MRINTHEKALKMLDECKKDLAEIFELIGKLKNASPKQVLRGIANLNPKEKTVLLKFIKRGETYMKLLEIHKKEPKYIN